ncbi:MAG: response regulator [Calditrichaeota bacterium]|nr:response regulator [Calditrichota bacterium]
MDDKAKILVVEDEQIVALDMKGMLQRLGYVVTGLAATGEQAIDKAGLTRPDLVLMDIKLRGEMDGVQAAQEIKARYGIPVIYLTANTDPETYERAMATGPVGYLQKPFELEVLAAALAKALQATTAGASAGSPSADACKDECVQEIPVTEGGGKA